MPESNFPSSLDTDANDSLPKTISNTAALNSPNHAEMHGRSNDAIIEIEEKVGIGDTTPTSGAILIGTGTGASAWDTSPTFLGAVTVGVDDTGHDVKFFGATSGKYMEWDESADELEVKGTLSISNQSTSEITNNHVSGREILQFRGKTSLTDGAGINIYGGSDSSNADKVIIFGGSDTPRLTVTSSGVAVGGALSKSSGSFDIPHPTKGGDWRLRHSFIEGPTCDNIYRGTVTLSGGSATVDLDAVSNMTDGTWQALNTNPWTLVSSSGNAVTWELSGKLLTIDGPDGAVCNWMVIGERKDPTIIESSISDSDGKLVVEYEDASFKAKI
tara:strand:- start:403 stop:1392 length:990 start_codon:yes stop_codon:yes gene_type:complete